MNFEAPVANSGFSAWSGRSRSTCEATATARPASTPETTRRGQLRRIRSGRSSPTAALYAIRVSRLLIGARIRYAPSMSRVPGDPALASRLRNVLRGEVLFDSFTRGRYSTDASIYQIE